MEIATYPSVDASIRPRAVDLSDWMMVRWGRMMSSMFGERHELPGARRWQRADPPTKPVLLVNPRSGGGRAARAHIAERARELGIDVIVLTTGDDLPRLVARAVAGGADALGMAGGDGSLAVVAAAAAARDLPFICVPAGTRNHFALDLGVDPHDPVGTLDAFTDGVERRIDMAEVNGALYLNNVSLGVYGDAVRQATYRGAKVRTLLDTAAEVIGPSGEVPDVTLVDDVGRERSHPAVLLVSNNPYALEPPSRGRRPTLDSGLLGIVVLDARPEPPRPPGRAWTAPTLDVDAVGPVHAGVDGEAVDLIPPLRFRTRPAALRVRIPTSPTDGR
jgi:diacylglycerol kinase family enzyme